MNTGNKIMLIFSLTDKYYFYNIGNCMESCAITHFKKQRAKRCCAVQNEKLFMLKRLFAKKSQLTMGA